MGLRLLFFCLFFFNQAEAARLGLVVGGVAKSYGTIGALPTDHEFGYAVARNARGLEESGYEVTTLFDSVGMNFESSKDTDSFLPGVARAKKLQENMKFQHDYIKNELKGKPATVNNFEKAFDDLIAKAKPNDEVVVDLFMHGHLFCNGKQVGIKPSVKSNHQDGCEYKFGLLNPETGDYDYITGSILTNKIKKLNDTGAKINLNLQSCHSGAIQQDLSGLKNVCAFFASSANNVAWGCFPSDPPGDLSYTSVGDQISYHYYKDHIEKLKQDPFFKKDSCMDKIRDYAEANKTQGSSFYEIFWNSRLHDRMPEEPSISSLVQNPLFTMGHFAATINSLEEICVREMEVEIENSLQLLSGIQKNNLSLLLKEMKAKIDIYNKNILDQKQAIKDRNNEAIIKLQRETEEVARNVIQQERILVNELNNSGRITTSPDDPCKRKI